MSEQDHIPQQEPETKQPEQEAAKKPEKAPFIEEGSTIFAVKSDAVREKQKKRQKKTKTAGRRRIRNLVMMGAMVLLLAGGIVAAVLLIPKPVEEDPEDPASNPFDITVFSKETTELSRVTLVRKAGNLSVKRKASDTASTASSTDAAEWEMEGYAANIPFSSSAMSSLASSAASLSASAKVEDSLTGVDLVAYGLNEPQLTVKVETVGGASYDIRLGNKTPDKNGYYASTTEADGIYYIESYAFDGYNKQVIDLLDLALTTAPVDTSTEEKPDDYFAAGQDGMSQLARFDEVQFGGTAIKPYTIKYQNVDAEASIISQYIIPQDASKRALDDQKVSEILGTIAYPITASGAYVIKPDKAALAKYKMDKPEYIFTYKIKGVPTTLKLSTAPAGSNVSSGTESTTDSSSDYYAVMVGDRPVIYMISKSSLPFIAYKQTDYYSTLIFLKNISTVKRITITVDGTAHVFDLEHGKDEEDYDTLIVKGDGKTLDVDNFRTFYQKIIGFNPQNYTETTTTGGPEVKMVFDYVSGGASDTVELVPAQNLRYLYKLNGQGDALVTSEAVSKFKGYVGDVLANRTVSQN